MESSKNIRCIIADKDLDTLTLIPKVNPKIL